MQTILFIIVTGFKRFRESGEYLYRGEFFLQCFQYSLIVRKQRLHINKDPFLEFLTFLVGRVHAEFISLESKSAILLRHNQIVQCYDNTVSLFKLFIHYCDRFQKV